MRSNVTTSIVLTLVLSQEEAAWLHRYMHNAATYGDTAEDTAMRLKFFEATNHTPTPG